MKSYSHRLTHQIEKKRFDLDQHWNFQLGLDSKSDNRIVAAITSTNANWRVWTFCGFFISQTENFNSIIPLWPHEIHTTISTELISGCHINRPLLMCNIWYLRFGDCGKFKSTNYLLDKWKSFRWSNQSIVLVIFFAQAFNKLTNRKCDTEPSFPTHSA